MHIRAREASRARKSGVGQVWCEVSRKRRSVPFPRAYGYQGFRGADNNRLAAPVKAACWSIFAYSEGRIAIEIELSLDPDTCRTNGLDESSYFMVLRMPSQSVAPLNAFGFRK